MNVSVMRRLVTRDWYLHRWLLSTLLVIGLAGSIVASTASDLGPPTPGSRPGLFAVTMLVLFYAGIFSFFAAGIALPLVMNNERRRRTVLFSLSAPIPLSKFTVSKFAAIFIPCVALFLLATISFANLDGDGPRLFFLAWLMCFLCLFATYCALTLVVTSRSYRAALAAFVVVGFFVFVYVTYPESAGELWSPDFWWAVAITLGYNAAVLAAVIVGSRRLKDAL